MKSIEKVAKTVDEAVTDALIELGATTDEVEIEIIEKGSKGIFGLGAKLAKVRVSLKEKVTETIKTITLESKKEEVIVEPVVEVIPKEEVKSAKPAINMEEAENKAKAFLNNVLMAMGINATMTTEIVQDRIQINISGEKMGVIIGKRGETLDSLQYLTNIVVNKDNSGYIKVMIDTENYRARREETLRKLAYKLAKKASQTRKPVILEPMNPYDRRIIHSVLQDSKTVKTHSEGKEPFRKVVITPNNTSKSYK